MKIHLPDTSIPVLTLALSVSLLVTVVFAQSSPSPVIQDYDNTSLPAQLQVGDTTFCNTQTITIHGQNFKRATGGEVWDTTWVVFGIVAPSAVTITTQGGGNNDRIVCQIPPTASIAGVDTCMMLTLIKKTHQGSNVYFYYANDTICLTGDKATVSYGTWQFCLGDTNPLPSINLTPSTATGMFCCRSGASGFWVNPSTGEIPLHPGAAGNNNQFLYCTNHPRCADTVAFTVSIQPRIPAVATINGQTQVTVCKSGGHVRPDSANLVPSAAVFRSPTGLYLLNPFTGEFDPAQSPAGVHELWYVPVGGCYDSTMILVIVQPTATATVSYPAVGLNAGVPTLCQGSGAVWPSFSSGSAGGTFWAVPSGLVLGNAGEIEPSNSQTGIYAIYYATNGLCSDTVTAIANLHIDTTVLAAFTLPQAQYCAAGLLAPVAASASGVWQVVSAGGQLIYGQGSLPVSLAAAGLPAAGGYVLRHVLGGFCADTAMVSFVVLGTDNPAFTYPPNGNFCLGDPDPWPLIAGSGGGIFEAVTSGTVVDLDGRLHLAASGAGLHTIRHVTGGACPDSADVSVQIFGSASANFAYAGSVFCSGDTNPVPQILGTPGGVFAGDLGLVLDSLSGAILLSQSVAGTHNVTYTLTGSCQAQFTQTIQISPTDSATRIVYQPDHYCQAGVDPLPQILGDTLGSFVAGGGIVFSNTDRGQLDVGAMQPGGPYIVYFDIDNRCAVDARDSVWIDLPDDPFFSYPQSSYCEGGANPLPDFVVMPGGIFTEITGSVVFADSTTGEINAQQSQQGGPYFIQYTTAGPCPETSTQQLTILPKPIGASLQVSPDTTYCTGQSLDLQATAGGAVAWRWWQNRQPLITMTEAIHLPATQLNGLDTVSVALSNTQGCIDSLAVILRGLPSPTISPSVVQSATDAQGLAQVQIQIATDIDGTMIDWLATGSNLRDISPAAGAIPQFGITSPAALALNLTLSSAFDMGALTLFFSPHNASCAGTSDTFQIIIAPDTQSVFIPEAFTPDGNGQNDTWMITCMGTARAEDYALQLYNESGGKVLDMQGLHQNFDGSGLPDGVYWWVLRDQTGRDLQAGGLTIRRK